MKPELDVRDTWLRSWGRFWFRPIDPIGLHVIRLLTGLLIVGWLLSFAGYQDEFYGLKGWFDRQAFRDAVKLGENVPEPITWSLLYMANGNPLVLNVLYLTGLVSVGLFALGIAPRLTAVLTWLTVASFLSNPALSFEADYLLLLLAFYLMVGYSLMGLWNGPQSWPARLLGTWEGAAWKLWPRGQDEDRPHASIAANLALRLLQVHFAIVIVVSGLHKLQISDWWGGVAFWYPLHPPMTTTQDQIREESANALSYLFVLSLAQYIVLAWQLAFPFLAWRRSCRVVLLGGAVIGWVGSVLLYHLPLFGPVVFLACLSFVTAEEWRGLGNGLIRLAQIIRRTNEVAVPARVGAHTS